MTVYCIQQMTVSKNAKFVMKALNTVTITDQRNISFHYMPVIPRIVRWFGTKNLAKVLHGDRLKTNGVLRSYTDGNIFQIELSTGVFKDTEESSSVPLALFTDGVNPNKNVAAQKSMWPIILTWITLPQEMRYLLGPMMLVGIVPGHGRKEPKSLDQYIQVLVDELLSNMECKIYDSYKQAPVDVKIALLQYLCDIPAFSKLLHCSGQAALRSCMFCKDIGVRSPDLNKVIHLSNRQFLPEDSPLHQDKKSFAVKLVIKEKKPGVYSQEEEMTIRAAFDQKPNNAQKAKLQKQTGFKGIHPLHSLPYFDRSSQMQTDGMHTIADVIGNILDLVCGKTDGPKVRHCEKNHNRFAQTWVGCNTSKRKATDINEQNASKQQTKRQKKSPNEESSSNNSNSTNTQQNSSLPDAPWSLTKEQLKIADSRAMSIKYPRGFDFTPADHFSRQWTLRTMHGKQQVKQFLFN